MTRGKKPDTPADIPDKTTWKESPWLALKGFLMGAADIIPGVSGGTMALITGIYDRLVNAIRSADHRAVSSLFTLKFRTFFDLLHWKFILVLLTGILGAVLFFTRVVPLQVYMYTHPEYIYGLFFGLILGSVFILFKEVDRNERGPEAYSALLAGALLGFWVVTLVPADTPVTFGFMFLSGVVALCSMILPGISGSYILLILGKYDYVLSRLGELGGDGTLDALWALFPLILGGIIGLALFSRALSWLLRNYHTVTLMVLIGFLVGSLYVIWPYQERTYQEEVTRVEMYSISHPLVQQLQDSPPNRQGPSYERLGEIRTDVAGEEDPLVEVLQIRREITSSEPFLPGLTDQEHPDDYDLWGGLYGFITGLLLVVALDYLRKEK